MRLASILILTVLLSFSAISQTWASELSDYASRSSFIADTSGFITTEPPPIGTGGLAWKRIMSVDVASR